MSHGRDGPLQCSVERPVPWRVAMQGLQDFEMPKGDRVEDEEISRLIKRERGQMLNISSQVLAQIVQNRAGRTGSRHVIFESVSVERSHLKMFLQGEQGGFRCKRPVLVRDRDG